MKRVPRPHAKLLTLRQAEAEYGLPYHTLWQLVQVARRIPRLEIPDQRSIYVKRDDLERFIEDNMTKAVAS